MNNREKFRQLAEEWMELANRPIMEERKRLWRCLNDKHAERPMILVETCLMTDYVTDAELTGEDSFLRGIEKLMLENVRHAREVGDDFVLEPFYLLPWSFEKGDFGVSIEERFVPDAYGDMLGMSWSHPVKTPEIAEKLHRRTCRVDRPVTDGRAELLRDMFGDILPVQVGGIDPVFGADGGYTPFAGLCISEITLNLFKFIGMNNLYLWPYDYPELFHRLMRLFTDDFISMVHYLEQEALLYPTDNQVLTGGRYGYNSSSMSNSAVKVKDLWLWCTFEETTAISPNLYAEFILPYAKEATAEFGKIYFGCCERLDKRLIAILEAIKNIEAVSVSPFTDLNELSEMLPDDVILSRKPHSAPIAAVNPDWESAKKDIQNTLRVRKNGGVEFIMRDIYRTHGNRTVLSDWVKMVHSLF